MEEYLGENFRNGINELKQLIQQLKSNTTVQDFVNYINQNNTMYASAFGKLLNSYRTLITNQDTLKCVNSKSEMVTSMLDHLKICHHSN